MTNKKPIIKVFVAHHKTGYIYEDDIFVPIQVGKKNSKVNLGILGDDSGDNISGKNNTYSELTAQYCVRKNYDLSNVDYVGFCSYRRYMTYCFSPKIKQYLFSKNPYTKAEKKVCWQLQSRLEGNYIVNYNSNILQENGKSFLNRINFAYDIYLPKREYFLTKYILHKIGINIDINFDNFHYVNDEGLREIIFNILQKRESNLSSIVEELHKLEKYYIGNHRNIYIMKKDLFYDYMERLFGFLFDVENFLKFYDINFSKYIGFEGDSRTMGFLAENMINIWRKIKEKENFNVNYDSNIIFFK